VQSDTPRKRPTSRIVMLDPHDRVLLLNVHDLRVTQGVNPLPRPDFWLLVGGGIEEGEDHETALRREVHEEIGVDDFALGPRIWLREKLVSWSGEEWDIQETYFVGRLDDPAKVHFGNHTADETDVIRRFKWWTPAQIEGSEDQFVPAELLAIIEKALSASETLGRP
jgi:8-oxo-dGTP pyrophosphatase MutT (NUDIX family)